MSLPQLYSQRKPLWHLDRIAAMREGRPVLPVHVQLILSDLCNQDCQFCAYRMSAGLSNELFPDASGRKNPNRMMLTEKAIEIVDDCAEIGVRAIQFTGGGEPTVHPDHLDVFARAQSHGIETGLVTNGVRMRPEDDAMLGMKWVRVSVDAGDEATYAAVRRVPAHHWQKVWGNIETFAKLYEGVLGVGFVVTPENYRGIAAAARRAKDAGVRNMRVGAVFSAAGSAFYGDDGTIIDIEDAVGEAKALLDGDGFEIIDLFSRRVDDLVHGSPDDAHCGYQKLTWYIGGDLNVYRCCNTAYTRAGTVASLANMRLRDVVGMHEPFDARTCRACQFRGQNDAINAMLTEPEHASFV